MDKMDVEAIPIQVQTPPKENEPEPASEPPSEPMDSIEVCAKVGLAKKSDHDDESESDLEEQGKRDDEIVVGTRGNGVDDDDEPGADSPLSSAPESDAENQAAGSRMWPAFHVAHVLDISIEGSRPKKVTTAVAKLGDVEGIRARLDKRLGSDELLKHLHRVIYKRPGTSHEVKKNIRDFGGFRFVDSAARQIVRGKVAKFTNGQLKDILSILGLQVGGAKDTLVDNIVDFLNSPWDTKKAATTKSRRRSSGKVTKTIVKKKSADKVKAPQKVPQRLRDRNNGQRKSKPEGEDSEEESPSAEEKEDEGEDGEDEDVDEPPKKKAKTTHQSKRKPKPKPAPKVRPASPIDSSDDDVPLRPGPSDAEIKLAVRDFLKSKDLSTVTKGMVKEALREKYGETLVKSKKEVIAVGIEEGMEI